MIACYRRITCFAPKNVCRLFCKTSDNTRWEDDGRVFNLYIRPSQTSNVRALFISEQNRPNSTDVMCAIRVNAGSYEDPKEFAGLAHLTEHAISRCAQTTVPTRSKCVTQPFHTVFSFSARFNQISHDFALWVEYILSDTQLKWWTHVDMEKILKQEMSAVDNEFHEKVDIAFEKAQQILNSEGMVPHKFGWGNKETFMSGKFDADSMLDKLEEHRVLFWKRPVSVCLISTDEINEAMREHFFAELLSYRANEENVQSINWLGQCSEDNSKRLLVIESDGEEQELIIFFPFTKPLSKKEMNTVYFFNDMIHSEIEGYLVHYLREEKMGTQCQCYLLHRSLVVVISLTAAGLEHIQRVSGVVHKYHKFVHDNWVNIDKNMYRSYESKEHDKSDLDYIIHLSELFNEKFDSEFDIEASKNKLYIDEELELISEQIVDNQNVVHIVAARNPKHVNGVLSHRFHLTKTTIKREPVYQEDFYVHETDMFEDMSKKFESFAGMSKDFKLTNLEKYKKAMDKVADQPYKKTKEYKYTAIFKTEDKIFQNYFVDYLHWKSLHLQALYNRSKASQEITGSNNSVMVSWNGKKLEEFHDNVDPYNIPSEEFSRCKEYWMRHMSKEIMDSKRLARSLLETAVANQQSSQIKTYPLPTEYHKLKAMDCSAYKAHFDGIKALVDSRKGRKRIFSTIFDTCEEKFVIESINKNELTTVTFIFCKTNQDEKNKDLIKISRKLSDSLREMKSKCGLYTLSRNIKKVAKVTGLLIEILSVESKIDQTNTKILEEIGKILEQEIFSPAKSGSSVFLNYQILVQIKGYETRHGFTGTIDATFDHWFAKHEEQFKRITSM